MPIKAELYNEVCVLSVQGDLAADEVGALRKIVDEHIENKHIVDYVVDLEKASFIDSEGLEALLWMKKNSENMFGVTKLAGIDENIKKILEITRLSHRFETHAGLTEALKTMHHR